MKLTWQTVLLFAWSFSLFAEQFTNSDISLLNNRFRIDGTISQAAFVIYRNKTNQPVVLIKPDGEKIYFDDHPDNVFWEALKDKDIITVLHPEPGPWQAIGRISSENKIQILTDLTISVDVLPERLYQGETLKFTVKLMQGSKPVQLRDYLENVRLTVNFTELVENNEQSAKSIAFDGFADDGKNLDEYPNDGVFTIELPITVLPGKYLATISTNNGIFFRALEQSVLVLPTPISVRFEQGFKNKEPNQLMIKLDDTSVEIERLSIHAEFSSPSDKLLIVEQNNQEKQKNFSVEIDDFEEYGQYFWNAWVYSKDFLTGRALVFKIKDRHFDVTNFAAIEKAMQERKARIAEQQRLKAEKEQAEQDKKDKIFILLIIICGNLFILLAGASTWFFFQRTKAKLEQQK